MKASGNPAKGMKGTSTIAARPRWSGYVALTGFILYFVFQIAGRMLEHDLKRRGLEPQEGDPATLFAFALFAAVGAILVWLVPRNPVAWVFFSIVTLGQLAYAGINYGVYHAEVAPLPLGAAVAWASNWAWYPTLASVVTFLPLFFPTGQLLTHRWRWVLRLVVVALLLLCVSFAFAPGELDALPMENPLGVQFLGSYLEPVMGVSAVLLAVGAVLSLLSAILRFRRSRGQERQQMKWFVLGIGLLISVILVTGLIPAASELADGLGGDVAFGLVLGLVPISAGMAILKYKLYAIDTVINRVLVYGLLTAVLVAAYLLTIVALQLVLEPVTRESDLAVAVSTLAVAAAFRPFRARVQRFIDRRFYRHKYDSTKLLASFTGRLRNEVDLEAAHADVLTVVRETMKPQHASLWVKADPAVAVGREQ